MQPALSSVLKTWLPPILIYLLIAMVFWPDVFFGDQVFWYHDFRHHHYPWRVWAAQSWSMGEVPWWAPGSANGFPLLAEGQGGFLYLPTMLLFLFLSPPVALNVSIIAHHCWAALGMHAFARSLKLDRGPVPYVAGIAWGWSGFITSHALYLGMQNGLSWLGWAMLATQTRRGWLLAISVGALGVSGHPQGAAFGGLLVGLYAMASLRGRERLVWAAWAALGGLLAAPQLLASLELSQFSMRDGGVDLGFASIGALPPQELINAVLPYFFGYDRPSDIVETYYHRGAGYWGQGVNHWEMSFYFGFPLVFLAIAGLRRRTWGWGLLLAGSLLLMMGGPFWSLLRLLPGFGFFRFPARFALVATFAVAILAAYGTERLRTAPRPLAWVWLPMGLGGTVVASLLVFGIGIRLLEPSLRDGLTRHFMAQTELPPPPEGMPTGTLIRAALPPPELEDPALIPSKVDGILESLKWDTSPISPGVLWPACAILLVALCLRNPRYWPALVALDLWSFGARYQERVPREVALSLPEWLSTGMTEPGGYRLTVLDRRIPEAFDTRMLSSSLGLMYGTSDVIIPSPLLILRNEAVLALSGLDVGDKGSQKVTRYLDHIGLARRMSLRYIATLHNIPGLFPIERGDVKVFMDIDALPRARVARCWVGAPDGDATLTAMEAVDPAETVVIEGALAQGCDAVDALPPVEVVSYKNQEVRLSATGPGTLVLADSWYPGWEVLVDGRPAELLRADLLFRGVRLATGKHEVVFSFSPGLSGNLLAVSGIGLIGCLGVGLLWLVRVKPLQA